MRIAIVHDWLVTYAGSERVLEQIIQLFPEADLFVLVDFLPKEQRLFLNGKKPTTSFIQWLPLAKRKYQTYLPLMPLAIEQFDLSSYDLIVSSSHSIAKGVITGPEQLHISYVHTPMRYAWDLQHQYLRESNLNKGIKGWAAKWFLSKIRIWDYRTANGVDYFVANSQFIAKRIWKVYRREAKVIYPPVDTEAFSLMEVKEKFYLTVSRMVPYKKVDIIVEAFTKMPEKRLVVIGEGSEFSKLKHMAGNNIMFLGHQSFDVVKDYMQRAQAFIYAAEEDFGIVPVEAQACGTPVIAYGKGGVLETINGIETTNPTGVFFKEQDAESIVESVDFFEKNINRFDPRKCRDKALNFSKEKFKSEFAEFVRCGLINNMVKNR